MEPVNRDLEDQIGMLPPIAGGDGEGDEGAIDQTAGDDTGGGDPGSEGQQEGQPGDEGQVEGDQQQQQQGDQQQGQGQAGQPGGEFGGSPAGSAPGSVPYSRFKEVNDRLRAVEQERSLLFNRFAGEGKGQGQGNGQPARQLPTEYAELDKGMGGYMRHYLDPIAEHIIETREIISNLSDESRFYRGVGRGLNEQQADLVEQAREALSTKMRQPVERADALLFLRGHPTHGKLFVNQQARQEQQLANGVATARRQAGQVGGRKPVARTATPGTVDLNTLPRSQRVKVFEQAMGNTPV